MRIEGIIVEIGDVVQASKDFRRRNFVIHYSDRGHVETISFELFQDYCKLIDPFKKGDNVVIDFNLKGRKWTTPEGVDKYFNTLQAWHIELDPAVRAFMVNEQPILN